MEFLLGTIVMTYTASLLEQKFLDLVIKISLDSIYGIKYEAGKITILDVTENNGTKPSVNLVRAALGHHMGNITLPDFMLKIPAVWPDDMAPYIWDWIHIVSVHIDLNGGAIEKNNFVFVVEHSILCITCRQHYIDNIPGIQAALQKTSLTRTFLALHTHIHLNKNNRIVTEFVYSDELVLDKYERLYFNNYTKIKLRLR